MNEELPDDDRIAWDGYMPPVRDCKRLNYALKATGGGRVPCDIGDPEAVMLDICRMMLECEWDHTLKQWVIPKQPLSMEEKEARALSVARDRVPALRAAEGQNFDERYDLDEEEEYEEEDDDEYDDG